MGDPQQHQPVPPPQPAHQPAPPHPPAPPARDSGRLPRSRTVLLGALSLAPPAGIVLSIALAIATRWYQFFYGTFGCAVLCVVSFFLGIEAATRGRRELRWPPEIRPRLVELGIVLGVTGAVLPLLVLLAWAAFASSF